ncbi:beta-1,4-mannosyl-glycoprotein 4-beta-N-acetylglucosaminyltransferase [Pimephales promelas]|uniref:beta-1,4-mannosyl-glycoprotein 4-beta-N-acetylglucosaminyltransferase n=1 Tax=Pimephales promelas TaxID=90988 RepID=UPI001955B030|nr:beta-1,4-mannosyl-glycoprotein 4-beta-N-acetylglucosaminyltransferase [Pimephales promelas]
MKMRRHRVFLICTVGLCVISFLHYYKALHYVSLLRELSAPYPNIKSFIMVTGFFWKEGSTPLVSASPEEGPRVGAVLELDTGQEPEAPQPWKRPEDLQRTTEVHKGGLVASIPTHQNSGDASLRVAGNKFHPRHSSTPDPLESLGDLHRRTHTLQDDHTSYFIRTKAGALCFRQGTESALAKDEALRTKPSAGGMSQRRILQKPDETKAQAKSAEESGLARVKPKRGKRLVKCVCRPGWHGSYCGVPTMVYHSNLPTKERLTPRETPRRVINAINVNHEFDLLHVRFRELIQAVDLFLVCESNFTAYGERRPLRFLHLLLNGTYDYVRHKILFVFLDHFPDGGRQDGWIADDYLRTFLTRDGIARVSGLRPDDVFLINDADEIPAHEGVLFLKLFDGWTEPFAIHMRKSLYGFFWKQLGSLEVVSGCTIGMLRDVYDNDGIRLRRREYYTMPGFRKYENDTGHILVQWSIGSPFHFAGWHCSWCFTPEGIHFKLISAQNGDFPRWGDYEDKRDLNYIRDLIRTGGWFDGSVQEYPPSDPKEHMYAPKYMFDHYDLYRYLLENPYARPGGA